MLPDLVYEIYSRRDSPPPVVYQVDYGSGSLLQTIISTTIVVPSTHDVIINRIAMVALGGAGTVTYIELRHLSPTSSDAGPLMVVDYPTTGVSAKDITGPLYFIRGSRFLFKAFFSQAVSANRIDLGITGLLVPPLNI